jgi:hypothetical protein
MNFFFYYDIDTKFSPPLAVTNLHQGTRGEHKVGSPLRTEFSSYAWARNRIYNHILKGTKSLTTTDSLLVLKWTILLGIVMIGKCLLNGVWDLM